MLSYLLETFECVCGRIASACSTRDQMPAEPPPSPRDADERYALSGQGELKMSLAVVDRSPCGRGEELQLSGGLQLIILLRGRRLRGAHLLPGGEGIAVVRVDAKMFDKCNARWHSGY